MVKLINTFFSKSEFSGIYYRQKFDVAVFITHVVKFGI